MPTSSKDLIRRIVLAEQERRRKHALWLPFPDQPDKPNPQRMALESEADVLFFGGAAGGGKSDLLIGCAATQHRNSIIFRRQQPQLEGIMERCDEILDGHGKWNLKRLRWRLNDGRILRLGAMDKDDDWKKHQGQAKDFIGYDEICHFTENQFRNSMGWARPANAAAATEQRVRVVCAGNPPTDAEGMWVIDYWGPWLDENHPNPANDGELRWYATIDGKDIERPDGQPFEHFDERLKAYEIIKPKSRTFIRSRVTDNPYLMAAGYMATLQAMAEPMRSQMLYGDFRIGQNDNEKQVIPSAWIKAAMARWHDPDAVGPDGAHRQPEPGMISPRDPETGKMDRVDAVGADIARGGKDRTVLTMRRGRWFARQRAFPGKETPDGMEVATLIRSNIPTGEDPEVKIDVIGVGSSPYDFCRQIGLDAYAMNGKNTSRARDKAGKLKFSNMRAQWWWQFREALDPNVPPEEQIALPPERLLLADLAAPRYRHLINGIQIEDKDEIKERIGRSPDNGESCVYCHGQAKKPIKLPGTGTGQGRVIALYRR